MTVSFVSKVINHKNLIAVAIAVSSATQSAHAGWNPIRDIGNAAGNLVDAAHDVATLGEHGRKRDEERANAEKEKARIQREAAEQARLEKIQSLRAQAAQVLSHRTDLAQLEPRLANVVNGQSEIETAVLLITTDQASAKKNAETIREEAQIGEGQIAEIMAALKVIFADRAAETDADKAMRLESFEVGMTLLTQLAQENNLTIQQILQVALQKQVEVGKNLEALAIAASRRRMDAVSMLTDLKLRIAVQDQKIAELNSQLALLDPVGELITPPALKIRFPHIRIPFGPSRF